TPNNTVVKATGPELILHKKDDTSHTIGWNITHYTGGPINPTFTVTVRIYDLSGNLVETLVEEDVSVGQDSTNWDQDLPEQNGVYTYSIEASHDFGAPPPYPCDDHDKSAALEISNVDTHIWDVDLDEEKVTFSVWYYLNQAASGVCVRVYKPQLECVFALAGLPANAGTHHSLQYDVPPRSGRLRGPLLASPVCVRVR
ncbi:MAG: hypothetical protein AB7Y46_18640, partial [Armatimonadota bacterium]